MRAIGRVILVAFFFALAPGCARRAHERATEFVAITAQDETGAWDDEDIVHANKLGTTNSALAIALSLWGPAGVVLALAAIWTAVHRRRARLEAATVKDAPFVDGPAVLRGVVETDGGDAITVRITQRRKTFKDKAGNTHTQWFERAREVFARPFRVLTEDGRAVRVEPDARVLLRDAVEPAERVDDEHRRRHVRLRPGERVWIAGTLSGSASTRGQGAYREGVTAAVLKGSRLTRMIVSTEAPGDHWAKRSAFHRGWFRGVLIALAVTHCTLLWDYTLQTLSAHTETLAITRANTWDVWVKPKNQSGYWQRHCGVEGRARPEDLIEAQEVSCTFHRCVAQGRCHTLPTQRAALTADLLREPGRGPALHVVQVIFAAFVGWIALIAYLVSTRETRPWYAGGKVNDLS